MAIIPLCSLYGNFILFILLLLSSFSSALDKEQLHLMLINLHKCLLEYFTEKDRETFLCKTLPQITQLASELPKHIPPDGISFLKQERGIDIQPNMLIK